jgi:hypothetical protein
MTHGIVEALIENSLVQSAVGLNGDGDTYKVYPVMIPQGEKPPYVCARVTGITPSACKGEPTLQERDRVQVDCYAASYQEAYTLYRIVRNVLDNMSNTLSDGTKIEVTINDAVDMTEQQMNELARIGVYGVMSFYDVEVTLGDIT